MFAALPIPSSTPTLVTSRAQLSFLSSHHFILSYSSHGPLICRFSLDVSKQHGELERRKPRSVLVERYADGKEKRYVLDNNRHIQSFWEEGERLMNKTLIDDFPNLYFLPKKFRDFVLPASFPVSVSDDYLDYMLLQFPTNITGWICHTLVTSSLLKAVGVGSFSGTSVAASTAAIQWVLKDGLGAIGRLFIGME